MSAIKVIMSSLGKYVQALFFQNIKVLGNLKAHIREATFSSDSLFLTELV